MGCGRPAEGAKLNQEGHINYLCHFKSCQEAFRRANPDRQRPTPNCLNALGGQEVNLDEFGAPVITFPHCGNKPCEEHAWYRAGLRTGVSCIFQGCQAQVRLMASGPLGRAYSCRTGTHFRLARKTVGLLEKQPTPKQKKGECARLASEEVNLVHSPLTPEQQTCENGLDFVRRTISTRQAKRAGSKVPIIKVIPAGRRTAKQRWRMTASKASRIYRTAR